MSHFQRKAAILLPIVCFFLFSGIAVQAGPGQLRFSLPPVMGSVPIAFAQKWGLFEQHGVDVSIIAFPNDQKRESAFITGKIDGMVCDVPTAALLFSIGADVVITSTAYKSVQTGSLALLSQDYFNIDTTGELLGRTERGSNIKSIAITGMSDLEYYLDTLLSGLGYEVDPDRDYVYWNDMLQLATFLSMGAVYAAVLPEPYITYIANYQTFAGGGELVCLSDFAGVESLPSVIVFQRGVLEDREELVRNFYAAYRDAIDMINSSGREEIVNVGMDVALSLFFPGLNREDIPPGIMDEFEIPHFPLPQQLCRRQYEDVLAWVNKRNYTTEKPSYEEMTTDRFLYD
jgi:NitT/TauT family transport system substrate-binding protein